MELVCQDMYAGRGVTLSDVGAYVWYWKSSGQLLMFCIIMVFDDAYTRG